MTENISVSWFHRARELAALYSLPDPVLILTEPPAKESFRVLVKKNITEFWRKILSNNVKQKKSLRFIQSDFLPLDKGPHPIFTSCEDSVTAVRAAIVQARIFSGRYRDDLLSSKWTEGASGHCSMPGCNFYPGDIIHLLSGNCPALASLLKSTLDHSLVILSDWPHLMDIAISALPFDSETWCKFLVDPTCFPSVILLDPKTACIAKNVQL